MQTRTLKSEQRSRSRSAAGVTVTLLLTLALLNIDAAAGRPDVRQSPFSLELQPPLTGDAAFNAANGERTIDSYGNPIDSLRPIDTPDGRKVVSAQGFQFEIPNYASGITEIRKPADDLLPPLIGELTTTTTTTTTTRTTTTTKSKAADANASGTTAATTTTTAKAKATKSNHNKRHIKTQETNTNATIASGLVAPQAPSTTTKRTISNHQQQPHLAPLISYNYNNSKSNAIHAQEQFVIAPAGPKHAPPTFTLLTINPQPESSLSPPPPAASKQSNIKRIDSHFAATYSSPTPTPSQLDAIAVAEPNTDIDSTTDSTSFAPASASVSAPAPATSLTPPKHESSTTTTDVEVEQAQLIPLQQQEESAQAPQLASGILPDYLLELQLQDPNIAGPVPWTPAPNGAPLSVIAWDLLPPLETAPEAPAEPQIITEQQPTRHVLGVVQPGSQNIRLSLGSGQGLSPVGAAPLSVGQVAVVPLERDGPEAHGTNAHVGSTTTPRNVPRFPNRQRGNVHYSTTTTTERPRSTTSTTTTTNAPTTTTRVPIPTTARTTTTTTTTTTTPRPRSTTTVRPISTTPLDPSTFYKLDNEENYAYTLPPWLQEVTDPDLDVAVTFIVPTDNDQYNHSLAEDLEPPFEPFVDLHNIQLTAPPTTSTSTTTSTTTTTTTTTTTRRPSSAAPAPVTRTTQAPTIYKPHTTQQQQQQQPQLQAQQQQQTQPQLISTTIHTAPTKSSEATTPKALPTEPNPFNSATLPPWLQDFDYPDVGPGVPYNPDNFKEPIVADGVQQSGGSKPNDFQPHTRSQSPTASTATTTTTSAPAVTAFSAFPSKVTLTLPAVSSTELNTVEPPLVLIPPVAISNESESESSLSSSSHTPTAFSTTSSHIPTTNPIMNFAARFDGPGTDQAAVTPAQPPRTTVEEQFPPFNAGNAANAPNTADNPKVEYTKSDEGKVISTPINAQRKDAQTNSVFQSTSSALPPSPTSSSASNTGRYTGGFGAPAGLLRPQSTAKPDIYVAGNEHEFSTIVKGNRQRPGAVAAGAGANTSRYVGGFGAPGGVLSPQSAPRPFQQQQPQQSRSTPQLAVAASSHHVNRFGGPPGILIPFDNVQRNGGQ